MEPGENLIEVLANPVIDDDGEGDSDDGDDVEDDDSDDDLPHPVTKEKRWRRHVFPRGVQRGAHG